CRRSAQDDSGKRNRAPQDDSGKGNRPIVTPPWLHGHDDDTSRKSRYDLAVVTAPRDKSSSAIPDSLLQELKHNLVRRHCSAGFALLDSHQQALAHLDPRQANAAVLVGQVAQWVDIGYGEPELVEELLARFPAEIKRKLPVGDYLQLRMAEGLL